MRTMGKSILIQGYDAIKWNGNNLKDVQNFGTAVIDMGCVPTTNDGMLGWPLLVKTEEGEKVAEIGDWVIRSEYGTYYVRKKIIIKIEKEAE